MDEPILAKMKAGVPLSDVTIIDVHAHLGPWYYMFIPDSDAATMKRVMARTGIRKTIFSANLAIGPDYHMGNEMVCKEVNRFPGSFYGYVTVNPHYHDEMTKELDFWFKDSSTKGKMIAIKIHPAFHQYPVDGEYYRPAFEYAKTHNLVILSHTWGEGPDELLCGPRLFDKVASEYPTVRIIVGHSGGNLPGYYKSIEVARKHENLFLDTCHSFLSMGFVEFLVENIGSERVLFSSDFPFLNAPAGVGKVVYTKLSTTEKERILGLNAMKLFGLKN